MMVECADKTILRAAFYLFVQLSVASCAGYFVGTVFAYGQTSSGKTYTMRGVDETGEMGVIPLSIRQIYQEIEQVSKLSHLSLVTVSWLLTVGV